MGSEDEFDNYENSVDGLEYEHQHEEKPDINEKNLEDIEEELSEYEITDQSDPGLERKFNVSTDLNKRKRIRIPRSRRSLADEKFVANLTTKYLDLCILVLEDKKIKFRLDN